MNWIVENLAAIFGVLTATVTLASAIANLTPTDSDNKIVAKISQAINWLALNFKK